MAEFLDALEPCHQTEIRTSYWTVYGVCVYGVEKAIIPARKGVPLEQP
jgi:hypothetical protein